MSIRPLSEMLRSINAYAGSVIPPMRTGASPATTPASLVPVQKTALAKPLNSSECGESSADRVKANWAGNAVSAADRVAKPATVNELQLTVLDAVKNGRSPIVTRGAMHSWSPVAIQTGGTAIEVSRLKINPSADHAKNQITVSGGMLLEDVYEFLDANGLAFTAVPMVTTATAAGAFATGSHGAHRELECFGDQVAEVRLIDGKGRNVVIDESGAWQLYGDERRLITAGPAPLLAARRHRGTLGVIYQVTFQCEPTYDIEITDTMHRATEAFGAGGEDLVAFAEGHEYASMIWFPDQDRVMMRAGDRTTEKRKPRGFFQRVIINDWIRGDIASLLMRYIAKHPKLAKFANFVAARAFPKKTVFRDNWHDIQTYLPGHANQKSGLRLMEYGIKLEHAGKALEIVREVTKGFPVPMPVGMRRVGENLEIEFMWPAGFPGAVEKARELEARFIAEFGADATPHEGKLFYRNPWESYPENERADFLNLKNELDPGGFFTNPYSQKFLNGDDLE